MMLDATAPEIINASLVATTLPTTTLPTTTLPTTTLPTTTLPTTTLPSTTEVEIITNSDGSLIDLKDYLAFELTTEQQQLFIESAWMYLNRDGECCIDLEVAMQWMGVAKKGDQKAKLKDHFTEGNDYQVFLPDSAEAKGRGGHNKQTILLTPDAFKKLAQMSEGRGKEVRDYFIAMERVVIKYTKMQTAFVTQQLLETRLQQQQLQTKIRLIEDTTSHELEKSREQTLLEAFDKKSVVYAGRAGEEDGFDIIKFGSTDDIKQRTRDHKRSIGDHYVVQLVVESVQNRELERQLKDEPQIIARRLKREINGRTQTELIKLDERFGINDCRDVLHRISQTLLIDKQYANMKHQEQMAKIELKRKRGDNSDSENDNEDDNVFTKFLKEKTVPVPEDDKEAWVQPSVFYGHFKAWCQERNYREKGATGRKISERFKGMVIEKRFHNGTNTNWVVGWKLVD
ncbi:hypothetical protein HK102_000805 [Quaeritorhiza haematococci]|nr:hypothetical protein HK102_000805 [Quaeritorhiza haematococci]